MNKEFYEELKNLPCDYGMGPREILVVLKAYAQYKADEMSRKPPQDVGCVGSTWVLPPSLNRFGEEDVIIPDSFSGCNGKNGSPNFWVKRPDSDEWKLTPEAVAFVDAYPKLYAAAEDVLSVIGHPF